MNNMAPEPSKNVLDLALQAAGVGIWSWDMRSNKLSYSQIAREICGFPLEREITRDMVKNLIHPDDRAMTTEKSKKFFTLDGRHASSKPHDYRINRASDGQVRFVRAYGITEFAHVDGELRAVSLSGSLQDITDLKQAMADLALSETHLRLATEVGSVAVYDVDLVNETIAHSPELNRLYGFPPEARPSLNDFLNLYAEGEQDRIKTYRREEFAKGETRLQTVIKHQWPDGRVRWLLMRVQFGPEDKPPFSKAIGALIDVTESMQSAEKMATVAKELRHRLKNAVTVIGAIASQSWPKGIEHREGLMCFKGRLRALGSVADLMFDDKTDTGPLQALVSSVTAPYRSDDHDPIMITGSPELLSRGLSSSIAMAVHELCTNAIKHGALSRHEGAVEISWARADDGSLTIDWVERWGPVVIRPASTGFGLKLLTGGLFTHPNSVKLDFDPDGLKCRIKIADSHRPG
jgi:PAS domain S-box-containing protein